MLRATVATGLVLVALVVAACDAGTGADGDEDGYRVTAPAGEPVSCAAPQTVATDPASDVYWRDVGIAPRPVVEPFPELAGIDVTSVGIRIDGDTVCGVVTLASAPDVDFEIALSLRDTTTSYCCAALTFRSTDGVLEVGVPRLYRLDELSPVEDAGADIRRGTVVFSGTLRDAEWRPRPPRSPDRVVWRLETRYEPDEVGPQYDDWLPPWESVDQRYVRHRDGQLVLGPSR